MLAHLRQTLLLLGALLLGYALGNGPFAEWVIDACNATGMAWAEERASRGPSGAVPLLVAGFLWGQGIFLALRRVLAQIEPFRAKRLERIASWDPSLMLGTRFGLHQYLERCSRWAAEDPTARTQSLVLFKIRGLGLSNETSGTLSTTRLLQRVATELRAASLPESTSAFARWRTRHFPRPNSRTVKGRPEPRFPARWSGATFALAFRELDAVQVVAVARELFGWIRNELDAESNEQVSLSLSGAIAVGSPGVSSRGLCRVAANAAFAASETSLKVIYDPEDVRATVISQMSDIHHEPIVIDKCHDAVSGPSTIGPSWAKWLRLWGPPVGCIVGAITLLQVTATGTSAPLTIFPLPDMLEAVQVLEAKGSRTVRLLRTPFKDEQSNGWRVSNGLMVQGNVEDGYYGPCQFRVTVTNTSRHAYYVSIHDFTAIDAKNRRLEFNPLRMVRMQSGLTGRWLNTGESWTAWMQVQRDDAAVVALQFEPDRVTRITLSGALASAEARQ